MLINSTRKIENAMARAESYEQWSELAQAHDSKTGLERWRRMDPSHRYDYVSIRMRLDRLRSLRARHDNIGLLFTLNEGIHGNMAGMGRASLYAKAQFGTKQLIVDYVDEIVSALEHLASPEVSEISFEDKLDFFRRAHHCFGRSSLMMSGAGTLLYFHLGVVKALWDEHLLPNILSGSSGGAIVGALVATHKDGDVPKIFDPEYIHSIIKKERQRRKLLDFEITPKRIQADEIRNLLETILPDMTFQEAFELTGRQLNISVAPAETHQTSRLLNAITSPNVYIIEAVQASTAVPGIYPSVTLAAKNVYGERQAYLPSRQWVDGSVSDDLPAKRLARLYGVNHYIVSQTNPHIIPFINDTKMNQDPVSVMLQATQKAGKEWMNAGAALWSKQLSKNPGVNKLVNMWLSVINQDYIGDVNIFPPSRLYNPFKLLSIRPKSEVLNMMKAGERATWPKIEMVRVQTKISNSLERILNEYEETYVAEVSKTKRKKSA